MYIYLSLSPSLSPSLFLPLPLSLFFCIHFMLEDIKFSVCKELFLPKLCLFSILLSLFQIFKKFQSLNIE